MMKIQIESSKNFRFTSKYSPSFNNYDLFETGGFYYYYLPIAPLNDVYLLYNDDYNMITVTNTGSLELVWKSWSTDSDFSLLFQDFLNDKSEFIINLNS